MNKIFHKLLSSLVSLMLIVTASFVPELFNFSTTNAVGNFQASSGVYELIGTSTNEHTGAFYLWQNSNTIFVAISVNVNRNQLNDVQMNGVSANSIHYLGKNILLNVFQTGSTGGSPILSVMPPSKNANNPNSWVVAGFVMNNIPSSFRLSVRTPPGHAITNIIYTVSGALEVFHEYPPTSPILDATQSMGSNSLGGIAPGTYIFNPRPSEGFEYNSIILKIDDVLVGTAVMGTASSFTIADGVINVSESGVVNLILNRTSARKFVFTFSYQPIDFLLTIVYEFGNGLTAAPTYTSTLNFQNSYSVVSPIILGFTPDLAAVSGIMPAQNRTVTVTYTAIDFTFTFDPNFGTGANVVQTFNIGGSVAGTTFARPGFTFVGWTLDEAGLVAYTGGLTNLEAAV